MLTGYTDIPHNFNELEEYVITEVKQVVPEMIRAEKCYFYDACSFRKHANCSQPELIFEFMRVQYGLVVLTRGILMELASQSGMLNWEYMDYIRKLYNANIKILVVYEEDLFEVMSACFSVNAVVNRHLSWAVRVVKNPTGTIHDVLEANKTLSAEVLGEKEVSDKNMYRRFFSEVRRYKKAGDNLGEELLAICMHLLSNMVGDKDGKYTIFTDDKGAIGRLNRVIHNISEYQQSKKVIVYSGPRMVQQMYGMGILREKKQIETMLWMLAGETIKVFGTELYDLEPSLKSYTCEELAEQIVTPGGVQIIY